MVLSALNAMSRLASLGEVHLARCFPSPQAFTVYLELQYCHFQCDIRVLL